MGLYALQRGAAGAAALALATAPAARAEASARPGGEEQTIDEKVERLEKEVEKDENDEAKDERSEDERSEQAEAEEEAAPRLPGDWSGSSGGPDLLDPVERSLSGTRDLNPDLSLIFTGAAGWDSGGADLRGGPSPKSTGLSIQALELAAQAAVDPWFQFNAALIYKLDKAAVEEAYGTTLGLPGRLQIRAGAYKTRFGRNNPLHVHTWHFVEQPLSVAKLLGPGTMRGVGVEVSQVLPLPWYVEWVVSAQHLVGRKTARSFIHDEGTFDDLGDLTPSGRLEQFFELSESWSLLWGISYANGPHQTSGDLRSQLVGSDVLLKWTSASEGGRRAFELQLEGTWRQRETEHDGLIEDWGGYVFTVFRPNRRWELGARYEAVSGIGGGDATGDAVRDPLDPQWTDTRHRTSVVASWMPSHFSRIRAEYAADFLPYRGADDPDELVHHVMLQLELVTGAHGAHRY